MPLSTTVTQPSFDTDPRSIRLAAYAAHAVQDITSRWLSAIGAGVVRRYAKGLPQSFPALGLGLALRLQHSVLPMSGRQVERGLLRRKDMEVDKDMGHNLLRFQEPEIRGGKYSDIDVSEQAGQGAEGGYRSKCIQTSSAYELRSIYHYLLAVNVSTYVNTINMKLSILAIFAAGALAAPIIEERQMSGMPSGKLPPSPPPPPLLTPLTLHPGFPMPTGGFPSGGFTGFPSGFTGFPKPTGPAPTGPRPTHSRGPRPSGFPSGLPSGFTGFPMPTGGFPGMSMPPAPGKEGSGLCCVYLGLVGIERPCLYLWDSSSLFWCCGFYLMLI
ncbi:uncharacterized protein BDR25DRAFT_350803 [Lindgomyces ingoldianus]|uniref:Uncharacterized protein n=1 Tax=Lindgomyces ingoldianus TaxID=673940 RepID=A0ACB6R8Q9_9PLEO|nr:uncharacterized protein BDR25DRAFT_350803 [Lindgomyces ingoldianus]KAF2475425.1 hypothetical protein BDR25DRAFT_350803 [Lindgomyces ingoldianus]